MVSAIRDGRFSLDELSDSMLNYGDLVNQTYEETLDPWDKMKVATNNLKLAGEDLAGSIFETLAPMMEMLSQKIEQVSNWYQSLDDDQKDLIVKIATCNCCNWTIITCVRSGSKRNFWNCRFCKIAYRIIHNRNTRCVYFCK